MSVKLHLPTQDAGLKIASGVAGLGVIVAGVFFDGFPALLRLVAAMIATAHIFH